MSSVSERPFMGIVGWLGWAQFLIGLVILIGVLTRSNTAPYSDVVSYDMIAHKLAWAIAGGALHISGAVFAAAAYFRRR